MLSGCNCALQPQIDTQSLIAAPWPEIKAAHEKDAAPVEGHEQGSGKASGGTKEGQSSFWLGCQGEGQGKTT